MNSFKISILIGFSLFGYTVRADLIGEVMGSINSIRVLVKGIEDNVSTAQSKMASITAKIHATNGPINQINVVTQALNNFLNSPEIKGINIDNPMAVLSKVSGATRALNKANKSITTAMQSMNLGSILRDTHDLLISLGQMLGSVQLLGRGLGPLKNFTPFTSDNVLNHINKISSDLINIANQFGDLSTTTQPNLNKMESQLMIGVLMHIGNLKNTINHILTIVDMSKKGMADAQLKMSQISSVVDDISLQISNIVPRLQNAQKAKRHKLETTISNLLIPGLGTGLTYGEAASEVANETMNKVTSDVGFIISMAGSLISDIHILIESASNFGLVFAQDLRIDAILPQQTLDTVEHLSDRFVELSVDLKQLAQSIVPSLRMSGEQVVERQQKLNDLSQQYIQHQQDRDPLGALFIRQQVLNLIHE